MQQFFQDEVNPTDDELVRWAYSGALEPYEDFDIVIADPEHLDTLVKLVADPDCPTREYLLGSLYCTIGHSDLADPRIDAAVQTALGSADPWVARCAERVRRLLAEPATRVRDDWCGWQGLRKTP